MSKVHENYVYKHYVDYETTDKIIWEFPVKYSKFFEQIKCISGNYALSVLNYLKFHKALHLQMLDHHQRDNLMLGLRLH